jgi:hypothetical protein
LIAKLRKDLAATAHPTPAVPLATDVTTAWIVLALVAMIKNVMVTALAITVTPLLVIVMVAPVRPVDPVLSPGATEIALLLVIVAPSLVIVARNPEIVMAETMMIMLPSFSASFREKTRL